MLDEFISGNYPSVQIMNYPSELLESSVIKKRECIRQLGASVQDYFSILPCNDRTVSGSILFFSGGAESALVFADNPEATSLYFRDLKSIAVGTIEFYLLHYAYSNNYEEALINIEEPHVISGDPYYDLMGFEMSHAFIDAWNAKGTTQYVSKVSRLTKLESVESCISRNLVYMSCENAKSPCGNCYDCFVDYHCRNFIGARTYSMNEGFTSRILSEVRSTLNGKCDTLLQTRVDVKDSVEFYLHLEGLGYKWN